MHVRKAVITAAGREQRGLPVQTLVDRDGTEKPSLKILIEEATAAGAEAVAIVVAPGDEARYRAAAGSPAARLEFLVQQEPTGYANALLLARAFTAGEPFLHLVGDHLYLEAKQAPRSAKQVVELAAAHGCAVSAVQPTPEAMLPYYGVVGGRRVPEGEGVYEIGEVMEKPAPNHAEQHLLVPGLRAGQYLCFFGIHVLTPIVLDLLAESAAKNHPWQLSAALAALPQRERYLALQVRGQRYNLGVPYGLLTAQLALGLGGVDRDRILTMLVDLLAHQP
jgi:UTP--glucose-1-phosphate uridylyltransferase